MREGLTMTTLEKFIAESQRICDAPEDHYPDEVKFYEYLRTALPQALQHLRELSGENAELRQRIADMQDEQRNPPTLRTVCETNQKENGR